MERIKGDELPVVIREALVDNTAEQCGGSFLSGFKKIND